MNTITKYCYLDARAREARHACNTLLGTFTDYGNESGTDPIGVVELSLERRYRNHLDLLNKSTYGKNSFLRT